MRMYDKLVAAEDRFFDSIASAWKESSTREKLLGGAAVLGVVGLGVGAFNAAVNNIDVSVDESHSPAELSQTYTPPITKFNP